MILIVRVDKNWGIGKNNKLLSILPEDMNFFKEKTLESVVIMGRKTLESFPKGEPLKNRTNIVVSSNPHYEKDGVIAVNNIDEAIDISMHLEKEIYVIGGQSIYEQLLMFCDKAYVTKMENSYEADTFCPNLDILNEWKVVEESETKTHKDINYKFVTYIKNNTY